MPRGGAYGNGAWRRELWAVSRRLVGSGERAQHPSQQGSSAGWPIQLKGGHMVSGSVHRTALHRPCVARTHMLARTRNTEVARSQTA